MDTYDSIFNLWDENAQQSISSGTERLYEIEEELSEQIGEEDWN